MITAIAAFKELAIGIDGKQLESSGVHLERDRAEQGTLSIGQASQQALPRLAAILAARDAAFGTIASIFIDGPAAAGGEKEHVGLIGVQDKGIGIFEAGHDGIASRLCRHRCFALSRPDPRPHAFCSDPAD